LLIEAAEDDASAEDIAFDGDVNKISFSPSGAMLFTFVNEFRKRDLSSFVNELLGLVASGGGEVCRVAKVGT
jgi:hypothetical protein